MDPKKRMQQLLESRAIYEVTFPDGSVRHMTWKELHVDLRSADPVLWRKVRFRPIYSEEGFNGLSASIPTIDIFKVQNKSQALRELRKLGYQKSALQMTRGAMSYSIGGRAPLRGALMITLGDNAFIITGNRRWAFISSAIHIENLRAGAQQRLSEILFDLVEIGVLPEHFDLSALNEFSLVVAIAVGERIASGGGWN
jgi:hypothetical protein